MSLAAIIIIINGECTTVFNDKHTAVVDSRVETTTDGVSIQIDGEILSVCNGNGTT